MKKSLKIWLLFVAFGVSGIAVTAGIAFNRGYFNFTPETERAAGENLPRQADLGEQDEEAGENPFGRANWFIQQRLFGLGTIPEEARQRAKEQADVVAPPASDPDAPNAVWTTVGPQPLESFYDGTAYGDDSGRINWIAVSPADSNIVLVGTATGGIWRSTNALAADGQVVFSPVSDNQVDLAVGTIAFAPSNPNIVYAGMGDADNAYLGTGILKSTDAGATWTRLPANGIPDRGFSLSITVDSQNPDNVLVVRGLANPQSRNFPFDQPQDAGIYRSTDGGLTWTKPLTAKVSSLVQRPGTASNIFYASVLTVGGGAAAGIYKSTDSGANFNIVANTPDISTAEDYRAAINPPNPNKIYFYGGIGSNDNPPTQGDIKLIVMNDDATNPPTFTVNTLAFNQIDRGQFGYNTYLVADPTIPGRLYVGSRDVYRLTVDTNTNNVTNSENLTNGFTFNNGTTMYDFTENGSKVHTDQQHLAFAGTDSTKFFVAHDGGISRTDNTGAAFTKNLNQTLSLNQVIGLSVKPTDQTKIYVGSQDNGTDRRVTGTSWKEIAGGDGGRNRLLPTDQTKLYFNATNGNMGRIDNAETATGSTGTITDGVSLPDPTTGGHRISFYPPLEVNGTDDTLYVGTETLAVCATCGNSMGAWTYPANGSGQDLTRGNGDTISAMAVQKLANGGTPAIYTGSGQGAFWARQTGSQTFTDRTTNLENAVNGTGATKSRYITSIRMDRADSSTAYITVSGFGTTRHVLKATNYGATVTPLNFAVDIPVSDFQIDPVTATTFYIGTDIGVFRSTDSGATWNQYNDGLPPVVVMRLEATNAAGTYLNSPESPEAVSTITAATYGRGVYQAAAAPTAAQVSISGRVLTSSNVGVLNAAVTLTDQNGVARKTRTNSFGFYRFQDVTAGATYIISVTHKRYQFTPRAATVSQNLVGFDFLAEN